MTRTLRTYAALGAFAVLLFPCLSIALTADELQKQIDDHNSQITQLNKEIAQYQAQLDATSAQKKTLQNALNQLNLSIKKVTASISVTKNKISTTQLEIQKLSQGIAAKQASIDVDVAGIKESLRNIRIIDSDTLILRVLSAEDISAAWKDIDATESLQEAIGNRIKTLSQERQSLADTKAATEAKKVELVKQQKTLTSQKGSLDATKRAENDLLVQTKAKESNFQAILAQKKAQEAQFEQALSDLQVKLQYTVNASQITPAGKGILSWPLDAVRITQNFGNTPFANSGAYNGRGHNGIDLAAPIGTPVKAALMGTVLGTGNTDSAGIAKQGCYSYGKWVMIEHANGLNTMYAHLSQVNISTGDAVRTGQVIGYSGETGYATGPHLHFGVYVSSATQILRLSEASRTKTPCANAVMPIAPLSAYLNPLNYL
jgi:murein DD-endopeptidase MepM/ murein hydrolase activator NlpD